MAIVPTIRCRRMARSLAFYTGILDFERVGGDGRSEDPCFVALSRAGDRVYLSSYPGDGEFGQAVVVETDDVDATFHILCSRGLRPPDRPEDLVHRSPVDQTWGTREFYVDDPDGNTLRFTQLL
jgi:catechol 2,3-dioxygenase-like lactoylglutathione lyase family enzyme